MTAIRPTLKACVALGLALGFLISLATDADARRRSRRDRNKRPTVVRLQRVAPEVATVPLGQGLDEVVNWARIRLESRYMPRMKNALDMHERAAVQMEFDRAVQAVQGGLVPADGTRTGFEVSVIAGEFAPGVGESILLFRDGTNEHYFFFTEGVLWKYARPLAGNKGYEARLEQYKADHGEPAATRGDSRGRAATWRGTDVEVRLAERRRVFRSDLVVVTSRSLHETVVRRRGTTKKVESGSENPEMDDFLEDSDGPE
jgi:hypothetical protein